MKMERFCYLLNGFASIGRATSVQYDPISRTPFADARQDMVQTAKPVVHTLRKKVEMHYGKHSRRTTG